MTVHSRLSLNETRSWTDFVDTNDNNIADGWDFDSDFPAAERDRDVANGYQYQSILNVTHTVTGGDVSIFRRFYAQPGDKYVAKATCKNQNVNGPFSSRLKLNEWLLGSGGGQGREWTVDNTEVGQPFKEITVSTLTVASGFDAVTIAFRAHLIQSNSGGGQSVLSAISLKRTA